MTSAALLIATVAILLVAGVAASIFDRLVRRRRDDRGFGDGDQRQIDILKRGEVRPWPGDF